MAIFKAKGMRKKIRRDQNEDFLCLFREPSKDKHVKFFTNWLWGGPQYFLFVCFVYFLGLLLSNVFVCCAPSDLENVIKKKIYIFFCSCCF